MARHLPTSDLACEERHGFLSRRWCFLVRRAATLAGRSGRWGVPF